MNYKEMQLQIFRNFTKDFDEDEKNLKEEPSFTDRQKDYEKREKEEFKRLEKVFKKDQQDMEEAHGSNNPKVLRDRMAKTILEIQKQVKSLQRVQDSQKAVDAELNKVRNDIQTSLNKKQMLYNLCMALLDKNHDLYLQHESMLEEERVERQSLAANFQDQMKDVSTELEAQKVKRTLEITENQEVRT